MNQQLPRQVPQGVDEWAGPHGLDGISDGKLLRRFILHREQAVFEALVRRHGPRVRAVCRRFLADGDAVEDAYQETFLALLRKAHLLAKPELLACWLYGVAARIGVRLKTNQARRWAHETRIASNKVADPILEVTRRELCAVVTAEVHKLPEKYRAAVLLHYWEGKTSEEVAEQLGCPVGSMSWRLGQGRKLLRERLRRLDDGLNPR